ncbi:Translation initiation factor 3 subunit b [Dimargaris xerosporica]|nr:Translation initiation factor 3 subunit b [Dimargaris xerosporica]
MVALDPRNLPATEADIDFSDIEEKYKLTFNESFDNVIVIDNLPVVDDKKAEKLERLIRKLLKDVGAVKEDGLFMPTQPNAESGETMTQGFAFVEFDTTEQAARALESLQDKKLDKNHILMAYKFTDVERYATMSDEYREPYIAPYEDREHLRSWLFDPKCRDQFAALCGEEVSINLNNQNGKPEVLCSRQGWTENFLQWSPKGTFLTTYHLQGVALWGGDSWKKILRLIHPNVKFVEYSPNESFLITYSTAPISLDTVLKISPSENPFGPEDEGNTTAVWDVKTGALLRTFSAPLSPNDSRPANIRFKWSPDDAYLARCVPGRALEVYQASTMLKLDKKSIEVKGIVDFEWSPGSGKPGRAQSANKAPSYSLVYWTPEADNLPARVTLMCIPSKEIVRTKNLFNLNECKFYWQDNGDYLCVHVSRPTADKLNTVSSLELFRVREKSVPVDTIEVNERVTEFAWEPKASHPRFAIISNPEPADEQLNANGMILNPPRPNVSFYEAERRTKSNLARLANAKVGNFRCVKTLEKAKANTLFWSPKGRHIVLATLKTTSAWDLEFWDLNFPTTDDENGPTEMEELSRQSQYGVTSACWDPTGRYFVSYASFWRHPNENGYAIWDVNGHCYTKQLLEGFKQFAWRPRPASVLNDEKRKAIAKNVSKYSSAFEEEDRIFENAASSAIIQKHRRLMEEWFTWRERAVQVYEDERQVLGKGPPPATTVNTDEEEIIEEWVEELVEETEEIVE